MEYVEPRDRAAVQAAIDQFYKKNVELFNKNIDSLIDDLKVMANPGWDLPIGV